MENQETKSTIGYKIAIALLLLGLGGTGYYIYDLKQKQQSLENTLKNTTSEKAKFQKELELKISEFDQAIQDNTALKTELEEGKAKIVELLDQLRKSENDIISLTKIKNSYGKIKSNSDLLLTENAKLKADNNLLTRGLDSTNNVLNSTKDSLTVKSKLLATALQKSQKIAITNLNVITVKQKSNGKEEVTNKANKTNSLRVGFSLIENAMAKSGNRTYYIQIIDSKNNVIGEKRNEAFGDSFLPYSFSKTINYNNETVSIEEIVPVKNLPVGTYFVNMFDKDGKIVTKSTFSLM
jgi:hypothetical protein